MVHVLKTYFVGLVYLIAINFMKSFERHTYNQRHTIFNQSQTSIYFSITIISMYINIGYIDIGKEVKSLMVVAHFLFVILRKLKYHTEWLPTWNVTLDCLNTIFLVYNE